jgi:hypothetical protein
MEPVCEPEGVVIWAWIYCLVFALIVVFTDVTLG